MTPTSPSKNKWQHYQTCLLLYSIYFATNASHVRWLTLYFANLDFKASQIGYFTATYRLGAVVTGPLFTGLADKFQSARTAILLGVCIVRMRINPQKAAKIR